MHDLGSSRDELMDELSDEVDPEVLDLNEGEFEEEEIASQLLEATSDEELDHFFGDILKGAKRLMKSPAGKMLLGSLKGLAKKALPMAGSALGNMFVPGLGGVIGSKLGGAVGNMFEHEGSDEGVQLEVAKQVVRTAKSAAALVQRDPRVIADPRAAVQAGLTSAVQRHLPGLMPGSTALASRRTGRLNGRWYRRGNRIILVVA
jgi:hypothetical protein